MLKTSNIPEGKIVSMLVHGNSMYVATETHVYREICGTFFPMKFDADEKTPPEIIQPNLEDGQDW